MLTEKMLQFKLPAAHSVRNSSGEAQGFTPLCPPRACFHIRRRKDDGFQDSSRADCRCGEGGDGREESTNELHTNLEGEVVEEIRDFLEWVERTMGGVHQFGCCGFGGPGFDNCDFFLLRLRSGRLRGCCSFGIGLLRPGRLPGGGHFRLLGPHHDRLG